MTTSYIKYQERAWQFLSCTLQLSTLQGKKECTHQLSIHQFKSSCISGILVTRRRKSVCVWRQCWSLRSNNHKSSIILLPKHRGREWLDGFPSVPQWDPHPHYQRTQSVFFPLLPGYSQGLPNSGSWSMQRNTTHISTFLYHPISFLLFLLSSEGSVALDSTHSLH